MRSVGDANLVAPNKIHQAGICSCVLARQQGMCLCAHQWWEKYSEL